MRILLIEDDVKISKNIRFFLEQYKYIVNTSYTIESAKEQINTNDYDIILLDLMLSDGDGIEILKLLRTIKNSTPVLTMTAKSMLNDKIEAFELGTDDYLVKPFALPELLLRIKSIIRRSSQNSTQSNIKFGSFEIDMNRCEVKSGENILEIKGKLYAFLEYLILNMDRVVSREDLSTSVLDSTESNSNLIEVYVATLRKEFKKYSDQELIKTVKGKGYMLCSN